MDKAQYQGIAKFEGLEFIKALLSLEEQQFEQTNFFKKSTFEEINVDFGIFPSIPVYPVYFAGDVREPSGKIVLLGINPGFDERSNYDEQQFLRS
jgi:hypothetical protein